MEQKKVSHGNPKSELINAEISPHSIIIQDKILFPITEEEYLRLTDENELNAMHKFYSDLYLQHCQIIQERKLQKKPKREGTILISATPELEEAINEDQLTTWEENYLLRTYHLSTSEKAKMQAMDRLITANLRLVLKFVKNYAHQEDPDSLFQEGIFGLMTGIEKFDVTKSNTFSTYVSWWIMQRMSRYTQDNLSLISYTQAIIERMNALKKLQAQLTISHPHLTREEQIPILAQQLSLPEKKVREAIVYIKQLHVASFSKVVNPDENVERIELHPSDTDVEQDGLDAIIIEHLMNNLSLFDDVQKIIILLRCGVNGQMYTFPEIQEVLAEKYDIYLTRGQLGNQWKKCLAKLQPVFKPYNDVDNEERTT